MNIKFGSDEIKVNHARLKLSLQDVAILTRLKKSTALFHIRIATSAWVICMSHLNCSVGQVGQQVWPTSTLDIQHSFWHENLCSYSYQDSFIYKNSLL